MLSFELTGMNIFRYEVTDKLSIGIGILSGIEIVNKLKLCHVEDIPALSYSFALEMRFLKNRFDMSL